MGISSLIDSSRAQIVLGEYAVCRATALADANLLARTQDFRRQIGGRMMALDTRGMREKMPTCDYLVSRKIDGEFCVLAIADSTACTVNPGGTVRIGLPLLAEACALLKKAGIKTALIAGELYVGRTDKRPRVHDVCRVARQPASQAEIDSLHFAVFDLIELDGKPAPAGYAEVFKKIQSIFKAGKLVHPVETQPAKNCAEIEKLYEQWVEKDGAEGIVARSDAAGMFKIKPICSLDVAVVGFTEGGDDRAGMLHDMLVAVMRPEATFHILGRVGGGFSDDERRDFLSDLKDLAAESEYSEVNEGVCYQMVRPEWVIEISCLDLISQSTRGASIDRMVLDWDKPKSQYRVLRRLPLCSPISPQFLRRRQDKSIVPTDLRLQQIADIVEVPIADRDARLLTMPKSEMLARHCFTKVLKGQTMVRKLMLWKTNKETEDADFPAYVAYFTDFSPNRKTPLERDIRVSSSREQIEQLLAEMRTEYVVKGWQPA
jgi:ATP dependent DNA ligase-like protein